MPTFEALAPAPAAARRPSVVTVAARLFAAVLVRLAAALRTAAAAIARAARRIEARVAPIARETANRVRPVVARAWQRAQAAWNGLSERRRLAVKIGTPILVLSLLVGVFGGLGPSLLSTPDDDRQDWPTTAFSGRVVLGRVENATVTVHPFGAGGRIGPNIGSATTAADGSYVAAIRSTGSEALFVRAAGGSYVEEATGQRVQLDSTNILTAVVADARQGNAFVTPFTHMAAARAQSLARGAMEPAEAVRSANRGLEAQYALPDPVHTDPADLVEGTDYRGSSAPFVAYGALIAGLSEMARELGTDSFRLAEALAADAQDGALDGRSDADGVLVARFDGSHAALGEEAGRAELAAGVGRFAASNRSHGPVAPPVFASDIVPLGNRNATLRAVVDGSLVVTGERTARVEILGESGLGPYRCREASPLPDLTTVFSDCEVSFQASPPYENPVVDGETLSRPIVVRLTDSSSPPQTQYVTLVFRIQVPPLVIHPTVGDVCTAGVYCNRDIAHVRGGVPPYDHSFEPAADPYLSFNGNGAKAQIVGVAPLPNEGHRAQTRHCVTDAVGERACVDWFGGAHARTTPAPPTHTVSVLVTHLDKTTPIAGAEVRFSSDAGAEYGGTSTTDSSGRTTFRVPSEQSYYMAASKAPCHPTVSLTGRPADRPTWHFWLATTCDTNPQPPRSETPPEQGPTEAKPSNLVKGTVRKSNAGGGVVPGVEIQWSTTQASGKVYTDAQGRFEFTLPSTGPQSYRLKLSKECYWGYTADSSSRMNWPGGWDLGMEYTCGSPAPPPPPCNSAYGRLSYGWGPSSTHYVILNNVRYRSVFGTDLLAGSYTAYNYDNQNQLVASKSFQIQACRTTMVK